MSACGHQPSCSNRLGESSRLAVFLLFYKEKGFYARPLVTPAGVISAKNPCATQVSPDRKGRTNSTLRRRTFMPDPLTANGPRRARALAHNFLWKTSLRRRLAPPCVQSPAAAGRWKGHPVARAAVRPAAPVRLGRGSEPLRLISTERRPSSRRRQAPALGLMYNPNDDPDVISGLCDDAKKEMATTPGPSQGL
mgnify:CR=1 FL=1